MNIHINNAHTINPVELLQNLIRCPSVTPNSEGSLELVEKVLQQLGFTVEIIEFTDAKSYPVKNLYATLGDGPNSLAFCGHLDVVPPGDNWKVPPFSGEIQDGYIIGRGAEDMKGGIAAFISAVGDYLKDFNSQTDRLIFLLTLDEESLAINGVKKLLNYVVEKENNPIKGCILGEPTCLHNIGDCIKVGRRGSLNFVVEVTGKQGHVAYKDLFLNPVGMANKILTELIGLELHENYPKFELSNLEVTGVKTSTFVHNIVPRQVDVCGNVRFNPAYTLQEVKNYIIQATNKALEEGQLTLQNSDEYVAHNESGLQVVLKFLPDASSPFQTSEEAWIYKSLQQAVVEVVGKKAQPNTLGGTSDARFITKYTDVIEFGLIEKTLHQVNERVSVEELLHLTEIYKIFLKNYFSNS